MSGLTVKSIERLNSKEKLTTFDRLSNNFELTAQDRSTAYYYQNSLKTKPALDYRDNNYIRMVVAVFRRPARLDRNRK